MKNSRTHWVRLVTFSVIMGASTMALASASTSPAKPKKTTDAGKISNKLEANLQAALVWVEEVATGGGLGENLIRALGDNLEVDVNHLKTQHAAAEQAITEQGKWDAHVDNALRHISESMVDLDAEMSQGYTDLQGVSTQVGQNKSQIAQNRNDIRQLDTNGQRALQTEESKVAQNAAAIRAGQSQISQTQDEIARTNKNAQEALETAKMRASEYAPAIRADLSQIKQNKETLETAKTRVGEYAPAIRADMSQIKQNKETLETAKMRAGEYAPAIRADLSQIKQNQNDIATAKLRATETAPAIQQEIKQLSAQVSQGQAAYSAALNAIAQTKTQLAKSTSFDAYQKAVLQHHLNQLGQFSSFYKQQLNGMLVTINQHAKAPKGSQLHSLQLKVNQAIQTAKTVNTVQINIQSLLRMAAARVDATAKAHPAAVTALAKMPATARTAVLHKGYTAAFDHVRQRAERLLPAKGQ